MTDEEGLQLETDGLGKTSVTLGLRKPEAAAVMEHPCVPTLRPRALGCSLCSAAHSKFPPSRRILREGLAASVMLELLQAKQCPQRPQ